MSEKVNYVRNAKQTRNHTCHWPECTQQVPPAMWGCKEHWFKLPHRIRNAIWAAYDPGQEIDLDVSEAYLKAADDAQQWIKLYEKNRLNR